MPPLRSSIRQFLISSILLLSACATVTADSEQVIGVTTSPAGASCTLANGQGTREIATTPGSAKVARSFSPLTITCSKKGAGSATQTVEAKTRGRAYGNIALLGIPAIVDAGTGAGYEYEPAAVELVLTK